MRKRQQLSQVKRKLIDWRANCWLPITRGGRHGFLASKFGGTPALRAGEPWPNCPQCRHPMPLLLQLNFEELPPSSKSRKDSRGLVQLFFCTAGNCDTTEYAKQP